MTMKPTSYKPISSNYPEIDALDPVYARGTGTPEIGGDVVEVSPPFEMSGNTALVAVTMMFAMMCETLCLLAEVVSAKGS